MRAISDADQHRYDSPPRAGFFTSACSWNWFPCTALQTAITLIKFRFEVFAWPYLTARRPCYATSMIVAWHGTPISSSSTAPKACFHSTSTPSARNTPSCSLPRSRKTRRSLAGWWILFIDAPTQGEEMAVRKLKPIEERDPYAALVLAAFDALENPRKLKATPESSTTVQARAFRKCVMQPCENCLDAQHDSMDILNFGVQA